MTVAATERFFTPLTLAASVWDGYGETTTVRGAGGTDGWTLVCYLTQPLPTRSRVDFVVLAHEEADEYWWTFQHPPTKMVIHQKTGDGVAHVTLAGKGPLQTDVVVRNAGASLATLSLTQPAAAPSQAFDQLEADQLSAGAGADMIFALREICEELKPYIDAAAAATGPNGIPARLLAAVLFMEAWARPKDESPKAVLYRKRLEGTEVNPRWDALKEKLDRWTGGSPMKLHLHDIRDEELDLIRGYFNDAQAGDPTWYFVAKKTLGVGQIAMTTAAMAAGMITWRDLGETTRSTDLDAIGSDYNALSFGDRLGIFNALRFPKTNIATAAQLLTRLKNRAHRFPAMTPKDVVTSGRAIEVLATEYNRGGFDTPLASVKANGNGLRARKYVLAPSSIGLDQFFPDPP